MNNLDPSLNPIPSQRPKEITSVSSTNADHPIPTAIEKLSTPVEKPKETSTIRKIWSWFGFGKQEEDKDDWTDLFIPTSLPPEDEEEVDSLSEEIKEKEGGYQGGWFSDYRDENDDIADVEEDRSVNLSEPAPSQQIKEEPPIEKAIVKTYKTALPGITGVAGDVAHAFLFLDQFFGAPIITKIASSYDQFDKDQIVSEQKKIMLQELNDPQFMELYEMVNAALLPAIKEQVLGSIAKGNDSLSQAIASQEALILKLLEVVVARGFANLACQIKRDKENIPNFGNQPSLVSMISMLCRKAGEHIDQIKLQSIEAKYRSDQVNLLLRLAKVFPTIESQPESKKSLDLYVKEYIETTDKSRQEEIKRILFPDYYESKEEDQRARNIQELFITLDNLRVKHEEISKIFSLVTDDILLSIFPNGLTDIDEFRGYGNMFFGNFAFSSIKSIVKDLLQKTYEPLENSQIRNQKWEEELKEILGVSDLQPVLEAPSALLIEVAKSYIQSDPSAVETMVEVIDGLVHPSIAISVRMQLSEIKDKLSALKEEEDLQIITKLENEVIRFGQKNQGVAELQKCKGLLTQLKSLAACEVSDRLNKGFDQLIDARCNITKKQRNQFNRLSEHQLANWIIESEQILLHNQDPHITGLITFTKRALNNLTLALLAKGAKLAIPEDKAIAPKDFIRELSEQIIKNAGELRGEKAISEEFWRQFVEDLPLPPMIRNLLVPVLIEKAKNLQVEANKRVKDFQEIQRIGQETITKIKSFSRGEELLSIAEQVTEQVIEQVLEENVELVSSLGLGETIDELLIQYLPGVKINEDLKNWFKENITNLGMTEGRKYPQSIELLKEGIRAVLLKAMVVTIEKNFGNNSEDYAALLLTNIHAVFSKAFHSFGDDQKKQLNRALDIQKNLDLKSSELKIIQENMAARPEGITSEQMTIIENIIAANSRYLRASRYLENLEQQRTALLQTLNSRQMVKKKEWKVDDLSMIGDALVLKKKEEFLFPDARAQMDALKEEIEALSKLENVGALTEAQAKELNSRRILALLLDMTSAQLTNLNELISLHSTLQHAEVELDILEKTVDEKRRVLFLYEQKKINNFAEWNHSKEWMDRVIQGKQDSVILQQNISHLEDELDKQLDVFKALSKELTGLLGWETKEKLELPPTLLDLVWPLIESAQEKQFARFLFTQITPVLPAITDLKMNKKRIIELSQGNPFIGNLINAASEDVVSRIPDYFTSYKPFANATLEVIGMEESSSDDVERMESSLAHTSIQLGKEGTTALMLQPLIKGFVSEDKEEEIAQAIADLIPAWDDKQLPEKTLVDLLKGGVESPRKREEQKILKQGSVLAKSINQFLFIRGKKHLEPKHLLKAYIEQATPKQKELIVDREKEVIEDLEKNRIVENIQRVIFTPEEVADALNNAIPGAKDLHSLIAPQLQAVIVGEDAPFKLNREIIQQFLEGAILALFVKIGEVNEGKLPGQNPLSVITEKLKNLAKDIVPEDGEFVEDVARRMIDQVLIDILDIQSEDDLGVIPSSLRELAYEKIKEQAYEQLTPFVLPIIERNEKRNRLRDVSGSELMGSLCQALSKDVFTLAPSAIKSYYPISEEIFILLSDGKKPTPAQLEQFASEIADLSKNKQVKDHLLLDAFYRLTNQVYTVDESKEMRARLEKRGVKAEIKNIMMTPEEIASTIGKLVPHLSRELQKTLATELSTFIQGQEETYLNASEFIGAYIEGALLNVFIGIAEKNPKEVNLGILWRDSMGILTEKLLDVTLEKYTKAKISPDFQVIAEELNDAIMKDVLGIDSPDAFEGLPEGMQVMAYEAIESQVGGMIIRMKESFEAIKGESDAIKIAREEAKKFGIVDAAAKGYVQVLAEDLANMAVTSVPHVLSEFTGETRKGVVSISRNIKGYLGDLARGNIQMAKVLLDYTEGYSFQSILEDNLGKISHPKSIDEDKKMAADLVGNLLLEPLNKAIGKAVEFEDQNKKEFNQELMVNVLHVFAEHLKHLNDAKELAANQGRKDIRHQDFIDVVGAGLHLAVPKQAVNYQKTIDSITSRFYTNVTPKQQKKLDAQKDNIRALITKLVKQEADGIRVLSLDDLMEEFAPIHLRIVDKALTDNEKEFLKSSDKDGFTLVDLIRKEADEPTLLRRKQAYDPATKAVLKMLFPGGKKDLTFVPPELRGQVWQMFKSNLFPMLLPMLAEIVLDPAMVNTIVLKSLENMNETLSEDVVPGPDVEVDILPMDPLDQVAGELIAQALRASVLPEWTIKLLKDPKTGQINDALMRSLGGTLRGQFNDTFIKEKLIVALKNTVERNSKGEAVLEFDTRPTEIKIAEEPLKAEKMDIKLKKAFRKTIDVSISYYIQTRWVSFQAQFDRIVHKAFGNVGASIKSALDAVCRLFFFKIMGSILSVMLWPIKAVVKEILYERVLSLDESRQSILDLLTQVPVDQPEGNVKKHAVYHEDLVFKIGQVLSETVGKFLDEEKILPVADPGS